MKNNITFLMLFCSIIMFSQNKIFQNNIGENSLNPNQKIDKKLSETYLSTKYYIQSSFDIKSDLTIILPSNREIKAEFSRSFKYSNGSESSVFTVQNEPNSELVLSKAGNAITGMYASSLGEKIIFHQLENNLFAVSKVSEASFIQKDSNGVDFVMPPSGISQKVNSNVCLDATPVCPSTTIDVLIVYTTDAKNAWGGVSQSNSFAATAITNFNIALNNSGVTNTFINLVYSGEIIYAESGDLSIDLANFRNNGDGQLDDVHTLRTTYGADLCALVTSTPTNTCGLGYLNTNPTNYSSNIAFSASLVNCVVSNYSLSHEMGHNMGLRHDWYVDSSTTPCSNYHGYSNQTAITGGTSSTPSQRWRTIMAYNNECANSGISCTRVNKWANPAVNYNSEPTGIAVGNPNPSNEAVGFSKFACVVSQFMPTANLGTFEVGNKDVKDFSIFPNPAKDEINIWIKNDESYIFKVINILGQTVASSNHKTINLRGLPSGEYFLNVYNDKNTFVASKKFIIK